jgi:hypothetical protein
VEVSVKRAVLMLVLWPAFACAPLTFSEPGALDFDRYRVARVAGDGADYLARELAETSGFEAVTTDRSAQVDLVIDVAAYTEEKTTCTCDCDCGGDCACESDYAATASFVASTPAGVVVDRGSVNDASESELEAVQDVLDEVALHFIRPYRL